MRTWVIFCLVLSLSYADPETAEHGDSLDRQSGAQPIWPPPGLSFGSAFDRWGRSPSPIVLVGTAFFIAQFVVAFFSFFDGKLLSGQSLGRSSGDSFTDQLSNVWHLASKAIDYWTEANEEN